MAYEQVLRGRVRRGEPIVPAAHGGPASSTFEEFSTEWLETYVLANNKPSEQATKRGHLRKHLLPAFGRLRLAQIGNGHIEKYKADKISGGQSPKSVNNQLAVLGKALRTAIDWGQLEKMPRIRLLKVPPQRFDFLTPDESAQLLSVIDDPVWRAMIVVGLRAGLRLGELLGLQWGDVDLEHRRVTVQHSFVRGILGSPKNNRVRHLRLSNDACAALDAVPRHDPFVFSREDGRPLARETAARALKRYCGEAGIRAVTAPAG